MPTVNEEYVRGISDRLDNIARELSYTLLEIDPLRTMPILSGSENYPEGWGLSGRIRWQAEGMYAAFDTEVKAIDDFTSNVRDFLEETDVTELANISAQEFHSYLPGTGPTTTTNTTTNTNTNTNTG